VCQGRGLFGDGLGGEREQGGRVKKGLASVWARAWRALTCSDIVVCCWTLSVSWSGYSKPSPSCDMSCCLWTCTVEK